MTEIASDCERYRTEEDSLGQVRVDARAYHGVQTQRAIENFPISGIAIAKVPLLVRSIAEVKKAAAIANVKVCRLETDIGAAIVQACDEVASGSFDDSFPVDLCQGGAGTSTNMNANEVIANRALEILGLPRARYDVIHPNDHVNLGQSTNDSYATAVRLSVYRANLELTDALGRLSASFEAKGAEFSFIRKLGRTQLQDAVPMSLGDEFRAYAITLQEDILRAQEIAAHFLTVNLGATAIGTGAGNSPEYRAAVIPALREVTGLPIERAQNLIEATWDMGAFLSYSGTLRRSAAKLSKIANDLRLLSSGPSGGIGEIVLPPRQLGSSIMPGKVNPVMPEMLNCVAFRVFGLDASVTYATEAGQLQLNAFEPLILWSIHESIGLMVNGINAFLTHCVDGLQANPEACASHLMRSTAMATELVPLIGYSRSAKVAYRAQETGHIMQAVAELEPDILSEFKRIVNDAPSTAAPGDIG